MISFAAYRMIITRHYLEGSTKERSEKDQAQEVFEESEECKYIESSEIKKNCNYTYPSNDIKTC